MKKETIYFIVTIAFLIVAAGVLWYQFASIPVPEFSPAVDMDIQMPPQEDIQQEVLDIQTEDVFTPDMQLLDQQVNEL